MIGDPFRLARYHQYQAARRTVTLFCTSQSQCFQTNSKELLLMHNHLKNNANFKAWQVKEGIEVRPPPAVIKTKWPREPSTVVSRVSQHLQTTTAISEQLTRCNNKPTSSTPSKTYLLKLMFNNRS